jgi:hypothetical protein
MPKRQILEQKQAPGLEARKQGAKEDQNDIRHDESTYGEGSKKSTLR